MENYSRYVVGIDLGTSNSCIAYIDCDKRKNPALSTSLFLIPQKMLDGCMEGRKTLPSFCYLAKNQEFSKGFLDVPWDFGRNYVVGELARELGVKSPTRLVESAKSWLCNRSVDRRNKILPLPLPESSRRLSPLQATALYLRHIKDAWNASIAKGDSDQEFEQQEIILTVPASFDEVARTLSVEAAKLAGYKNMTLLEEPQAAFYQWIASQGEKWRGHLKCNDRIIVCDVGGGTSDFSLIEVKDEQAAFSRMAVGEHLLLGGDNMDIALCYYLEEKIRGRGHSGELSSSHWLQLKHQACIAKEKLLADGVGGDASYEIVLQGTGSEIIKGSMIVCITRDEIESLFLRGFFPELDLQDALKHRRGTGVRSLGLPYESEPSITKHIASFLRKALPKEKHSIVKPDYVLFNGGSMKPKVFQKAIVESIARWCDCDLPEILYTESHDLAVAKGAAYFGKARRGNGVRIGGGSSKGYYLGVEMEKTSEKKILTLLPRGSEEGSCYESDLNFFMVPNVPVSFEILTSQTRLDDCSGEIINFNEEEFSVLPPLNTVLRFGKKKHLSKDRKVPVRLGIHLSEIGTLDLWLKSLETDHKWNLSFQLRNVFGQDDSLCAASFQRSGEVFEEGFLNEARDLLENFFDSSLGLNPQEVMVSLEKNLGQARIQWAPSVLRGLWESLFKQSLRRKISKEHEARWWNLAGFFLRPGFGVSLDDFRIKEIWKIILGDYREVKEHGSAIQRWICYRRISGGLNKGQQMQLVSEILPSVLNLKKREMIFDAKVNTYEYSEKVRVLGSMELIEGELKEQIGEALLRKIETQGALPSDYWALSRMGARHLAYGSIGNVLSKTVCIHWIERLLALKDQDMEQVFFVVGQLARKTDQRELNLPKKIIEKVVEDWRERPGGERLRDLIEKETVLTRLEQERIFGERLPAGLSLAC